MVSILLKALVAHPGAMIDIVQAILNVLKADPSLVGDVVGFFAKK